MRRLAVVVALLAGCASQELTEVVVLVETGPALHQRSDSLSLVVHREPRAADDAGLIFQNTSARWVDGQYRIVLSPENPSAAGRYALEISALENGRALATARLISGYVRGQTRYVRMLLEDQCVGMLSCTPDTTCRAGSCVGAEVDPTQFAPTIDMAHASTDFPASVGPTPDATARDARVDEVTDANVMASRDAGTNVAPTPLATDTGTRPVADAARPNTDAETPPAFDASGPAPTEPEDAGTVVVPSDGTCRAGYYEGTLVGNYSYGGFGFMPMQMIQSRSLTLVLTASGAATGQLRVSASCVNAQMVGTSSTRPWVARITGNVDCSSGAFLGKLKGVYNLLDNTDSDYVFDGSVGAQLRATPDRLEGGSWSAAEPMDPGSFTGGSGSGSWRANWMAEAAPSADDPCAELLRLAGVEP